MMLYEQQEHSIVAPLVSEVAIPEPESEIEAPAEHDFTSTAEESPYAIEETPAAISLIAESRSLDDESAVNQSETIEPEAVSEVAIPEPGIEIEAPAKRDFTSIAEESPAEPAASYAIEETPAVISHSVLVETGSPDDESAVNQSETIEPEAVSTHVAATETVVSSPEPAVKHDDMSLSTVGPDVVVSSLEANVETESLESNHFERTAIEPGAIAGEEMEGRVEIEPSPATQADPASVTDVAPIATEEITEVGETVGVLEEVTCASFIFDGNILLIMMLAGT
jgi:hypothetical protein